MHAEQRSDRVLVLLGPAGGVPPDLAGLAAAVWKQTHFERLVPPAG